jgi:hypothetical protein
VRTQKQTDVGWRRWGRVGKVGIVGHAKHPCSIAIDWYRGSSHGFDGGAGGL